MSSEVYKRLCEEMARGGNKCRNCQGDTPYKDVVAVTNNQEVMDKAYRAGLELVK